MKNGTRTLPVIFSILLLVGCRESPAESPLDSSSYEQIIKEVETVVWAFHKADTSRNAEELIHLLWPESTMIVDSHEVSYQQMVKGSKQFMGSLVLFYTEWSDLKILPLSQNRAISSFMFRDSILNKAGELTQAEGPNTFIWEKRNGEWRVINGHAVHYPK